MKKNTTITIITPFYYPEDTAIGLYTTQFSHYLKSKGYAVKIITGFPNYPQWKIHPSYQNHPAYFTETIDGIEIIRYKQYIPEKVTLKGRVFMMLSLLYGTLINVRKVKKTDLVICIVPFTIAIVPAILLAKIRKSKLWIHIQDFEFDLALDSGIVKNNHFLLKAFKSILTFSERKLLNAADVTSSISFSMLQNIREKSKHQDPYYFPNWVSSEKINPANFVHHPFINTNAFTLLYSGNIGEKQDWLLCEKLCELIDDKDNIEIVIVGDGAYSNTLRERLSRFGFVKFFNPVPYEALSDLLCSADAHFLFQKQEVIDTIMPSKILGMMASAKPSVISGNTLSEVSKIINQSNCGYYFSDNNPKSIYDCILRLKEEQGENSIGQNARAFVTTTFSEQQILNDFYNKIESTMA
ncbi:glycosyltransferase family 4 protein [Flavobacterium sp.]|uniref:glycosyltransferase family 4 protein n=1 Tax=Flavobacterium sp. TaxID=239 RepID=UPI00286BBB74|nr:glycosyltransferase family 4 protein [Flavobacterium sp.]